MRKITGMKPLLLTFCAVSALSATNQAWTADVITNCAQLGNVNEQDINSTPNNKTDVELLAEFNANTLENDESCVSVTVDAMPTHSIGNRVWIDADNSGDASVDEIGVGAGVKLILRNDSGSQIGDPIETDANGHYLFSGLAAGSYQVCLLAENFADTGKLAGYLPSTGPNQKENPNIGGDDDRGIDNDDNGDDDVMDGICSNLIELNDQEPLKELGFSGNHDGDDGKSTPDDRSNLSIDFGVVPPSATTKTVGVGDKMWVDLDGNGKQDPGDPGLGGVTVKLLDKDDKLVATQVTTSDGSYFFANLMEGSYRIVATPPSSYSIVTNNAGGVDDKPFNDDSNCAADGSTALFTLKAGAEPTDDGDTDANTDRSVDCGFMPNVQIPTLSEWGLAVMSLLLAIAAFFHRRRED